MDRPGRTPAMYIANDIACDGAIFATAASSLGSGGAATCYKQSETDFGNFVCSYGGTDADVDERTVAAAFVSAMLMGTVEEMVSDAGAAGGTYDDCVVIDCNPGDHPGFLEWQDDVESDDEGVFWNIS